MNFTEGRKILAESAGRALSKIKLFTDHGFSAFTKYNSLVDSLLFYAGGVWGFEEV